MRRGEINCGSTRQLLEGRPVLPELRDALVPRSRRRRFGILRPVIGRPVQFLVVRVAAEVENVAVASGGDARAAARAYTAGRPAFSPRAAAGIPSTAVSKPTCASSQARRRQTCCRIASSEAMSVSVLSRCTLAPLLLFRFQHPRRIPFDHVVDRGSVADVADAVELIRRLENDRARGRRASTVR